ALQAARERDGQRADVERVLAVDLLGPSPARIARDVGVGRAHDQAGAVVLRALVEVARLLRLLRRGLADELGVPGRAEAVGLGELRRRRGVATAPVARAALRDAVVALDVRRALYAEPRYGRARREAVDLLLERHPRDQVADALLGRP